jgi:predicted nucleic acid-binding Zn ribbon protein
MSDREPMSLTASLDEVMRSLRGVDRREVGGLFGRWEEVVGAQIAAHVRPIRLDDKVLLVEVDEPAWATQVTFLTAGLRERLATEIGVTVERIDVRVAGRGSARTEGRAKPRGGDTPLVD